MKGLHRISQEAIAEEVSSGIVPNANRAVVGTTRKAWVDSVVDLKEIPHWMDIFKKVVESTKGENVKGLTRSLVEARTGTTVKTVTESASVSKLPAPPRLNEGVQNLQECMGVPMGEFYSPQMNEDDRIREAIRMLTQAIMDKAYKNLDDDGSAFRQIDYNVEKDPWSVVRSDLAKKLNFNSVSQLVDEARVKLRSFRE